MPLQRQNGTDTKKTRRITPGKWLHPLTSSRNCQLPERGNLSEGCDKGLVAPEKDLSSCKAKICISAQVSIFPRLICPSAQRRIRVPHGKPARTRFVPRSLQERLWERLLRLILACCRALVQVARL